MTRRCLVLDESKDNWRYTVPVVEDRKSGKPRSHLMVKKFPVRASFNHPFVLGEEIGVSAPGWGNVGVFRYAGNIHMDGELTHVFENVEVW